MRKIASVELLRFLSAMMVIIWHYQQFYLPYNFFSDITILVSNRDQQPFYNFLSLFYNYGNKGVDFFFIISGFVFSYVYFYENKKIKFKFFFINRLARLYPLHILTLIIVTLLQIYSLKNFENYFINIYNDIYHFFLNLFFISGWGFETGPSFNGPIWSVSVEIIIYFLFFFLMISFNKNRVLKSILLVIFLISLRKILSDDILNKINMNIINCGILFFEGVLIYFIINRIKNSMFSIIIGLTLLFISLSGNFKIYLFLPSILLIFLSFEKFLSKDISKIFSFLGNLTYGTYLWHLPLQILIMIIIENVGLNFSIINTNIFFIIYLLLLFFLSIGSFYFFENKARWWIRKKFNRN